MNTEERFVREPIQQEVRFDPRNIPKPFLLLQLLGSETEADVLEYAGPATSESIFDVLTTKYASHADEFRTSGFHFITISDVPFPVELLGDRKALNEFYDAYNKKDEEPDQKGPDTFVDGDSLIILEAVKVIFGTNLPSNAELEVNETESSQAAGALMDDHNEYSAKLSIILRLKGEASDGSDDTIITVLRLKSTNTFDEPSSQGLMGNGNTYEYKVEKKRLEMLVEK